MPAMLPGPTVSGYSPSARFLSSLPPRSAMPQAAPPPRHRRRPAQARSQHTVDAILEATALMAAEHGEAALNTNAIAERAGVSIGTLYQYFPSKEAIVGDLVRRERAGVLKQLDSLLARTGAPGWEPRQVLRAFVRLYLQSFAHPDPARRTLALLAWRSDHQEATVHSLREAAERIALHLQRLRHPELRAPSPTQAFVLTRALMGTVRAAVLEDSSVLRCADFEEELVRLCWLLLKAEDPAGGP